MTHSPCQLCKGPLQFRVTFDSSCTARLQLCARRLGPYSTQVNATGVMPVIFASSLLAAPTALARYFNTPAVTSFAKAVSPAGSLYLPVCSTSSCVVRMTELAALTTACAGACSVTPAQGMCTDTVG